MFRRQRWLTRVSDTKMPPIVFPHSIHMTGTIEMTVVSCSGKEYWYSQYCDRVQNGNTCIASSTARHFIKEFHFSFPCKNHDDHHVPYHLSALLTTCFAKRMPQFTATFCISVFCRMCRCFCRTHYCHYKRRRWLALANRWHGAVIYSDTDSTWGLASDSIETVTLFVASDSEEQTGTVSQSDGMLGGDAKDMNALKESVLSQTGWN